MGDQRGFSLVELIVATAIISLVVSMTIVFAGPWIAREAMRSAISEVAAYAQLAKIEAVSRNRECRFVVDPSAGELLVLDSMGTTSTDDDAPLHSRRLASTVTFERPDTGDSITLEPVDGEATYQTVFGSDGAVASGTGELFLHGGDDYRGVAIFAAGGIQIRRWTGTAWEASY